MNIQNKIKASQNDKNTLSLQEVFPQVIFQMNFSPIPTRSYLRESI